MKKAEKIYKDLIRGVGLGISEALDRNHEATIIHMLTGELDPLELPGLIGLDSPVSKMAAWLLANPEASDLEVLNGLLLDEEAVLEEDLLLCSYETKLKSFEFTCGAAWVARELFRMMGMGEEADVADAIYFNLADLVHS